MMEHVEGVGMDIEGPREVKKGGSTVVWGGVIVVEMLRNELVICLA